METSVNGVGHCICLSAQSELGERRARWVTTFSAFCSCTSAPCSGAGPSPVLYLSSVFLLFLFANICTTSCVPAYVLHGAELMLSSQPRCELTTDMKPLLQTGKMSLTSEFHELP